MLKWIGAAAVILASAGILQSWRAAFLLRIREMEQFCLLCRSAGVRMQNEHIHMPFFFRQYTAAREEDPEASALCAFAASLANLLEARTYPTGERAWQEAAERTHWHLKKEEYDLLQQSGRAFFGRDLSDNLKKLARAEAQMEEYVQRAREDYAEKNRVWTPVGMLLGLLLVIVFL